jgi:CDP-glucose 4,6-dehydratase
MIDYTEMLKFYKGKRVFITGHTGFKGAWLSYILTSAGAEVYGYALEPNIPQSLFSLLADSDSFSKGMYSTIGDIRNKSELQDAFDAASPEIVIHMAAQPLVLEAYEKPAYTYETNVMGTVNILECVRLSKTVRSFLNVTTDKVYENNERGEKGPGFKETDPLDGYDPYSNSKSCSELVTHCFARSFFSNEDTPAVSTARAGNVIGGGDFSENRIIPDCVNAAINNSQKTIVLRNPNSIRPYQHVIEPLFAYLLISKKQYEDRKFAGYYNVGPLERDCVTTYTLASIFAEEWNETIKGKEELIDIISEQDANAPHEANFLKLDCSYISETLDWKPKFSIREAIQLVVEWTKAYKNSESIADVMNQQIRKYI